MPDEAKQHATRYELVWGSVEPKAWASGNPHIITSMYAPFNSDFTQNRDLAWWQAHHPDWVLYRCDRKTPAWPSGLRFVPLDISNPQVVQWQMQTYGPVIEAGGFSGLAADLVGLDNADRGCGVFVGGVWTQRFTGNDIDEAWSQAVIAWMRTAQSALHNRSNRLLLGVNHIPEALPFGDKDEMDLLQHVDFVDDESGFTSYGTGFVSAARLATMLQYMKYIQGIGTPFVVVDKWNVSNLSEQQLGWAIGTYLLGKYHLSTLFVDHQPGYGYEYWYPQYDAKIGSPCGDPVDDAAHRGVFTRKYDQAYVVVNASYSATYVLTLPKPEYTSIFGERITSPLSIGPDVGVVLLTKQGCR